jgi:nicotinamide-nucleotide amidase
MPENNTKQALVPAGAVVFENNNGTAPGLAVLSGTNLIMLPGLRRACPAVQ